jgi:hypothetical protein
MTFAQRIEHHSIEQPLNQKFFEVARYIALEKTRMKRGNSAASAAALSAHLISRPACRSSAYSARRKFLLTPRRAAITSPLRPFAASVLTMRLRLLGGFTTLRDGFPLAFARVFMSNFYSDLRSFTHTHTHTEIKKCLNGSPCGHCFLTILFEHTPHRV